MWYNNHIAFSHKFTCTQTRVRSSRSRQGMNPAATWNMFRLSFKILWNDPNEIAKTSKVVSILFPRSCFTQTTLSITFFVDVLSIFNRGHIAFEIDKPLKNLCSSHCLLSKSYCQHFKSFWIIYPNFRAKSDVHTLYFQVCHFLGIPKSQLKQHMLIFNKTMLRNHIGHILTASWKWLSRLLHLCLVVEVCASSSSVIFGKSGNYNYTNAPHTYTTNRTMKSALIHLFGACQDD